MLLLISDPNFERRATPPGHTLVPGVKFQNVMQQLSVMAKAKTFMSDLSCITACCHLKVCLENRIGPNLTSINKRDLSDQPITVVNTHLHDVGGCNDGLELCRGHGSGFKVTEFVIQPSHSLSLDSSCVEFSSSENTSDLSKIWAPRSGSEDNLTELEL